MQRKRWIDVGPGLIAGIGIMIATFVAGRLGESGWQILVGPGLLALSFSAAASLQSRLRGAGWSPSPAALLLGGSVILATLIFSPDNPHQITTMIAIWGASAWPVVMSPGRPCGTRRAVV